MNILIIGNGFDLAHGLPTTYRDFLNFVEVVCKIKDYHGTFSKFEATIEKNKDGRLHEGVVKYIASTIKENVEPNMHLKDIYVKGHSLVIDEIINLAESNVWIKWFQKSPSLINEGWIDFESEISRVVQSFERISKLISSGNYDGNNLPSEDVPIIHCFFNKQHNISNITIYDFNSYQKTMSDDLDGLIRCLELYLEDYVRNIDELVLSPDIYNLRVDKLLSFNYTDTYARLYTCKNRGIEYDYIHGKSKIENQPDNNMVLGIDEYLDDKERDINTSFIVFKKYFQRIHKATGSRYKNWLKEIEKSKAVDHNVYIFGHSLDTTDKDILYEIITSNKVTTSIFHKDAEMYGRQITNLVKVLGQDKLISMVYANPPKIKFIIQKCMLDKCYSGWQVLNDTQYIWNLHELSSGEIQNLFDRIKKRICEKDLGYFHNQKQVISLYDVLTMRGCCDEADKKNLFDIACSLYREEEGSVFNVQDWNNADYSGEYPCDPLTAEFINNINMHNKQYMDSLRKFEDFDVENLSVLCSQIEKFKIDKETFVSLFEYLLSLFDVDKPNINLIWKCIYKLGDRLPLEKWSGFIGGQLAKVKDDCVGAVRLRHIQEAIDEQEFYARIYKQREEEEYSEGLG